MITWIVLFLALITAPRSEAMQPSFPPCVFVREAVGGLVPIGTNVVFHLPGEPSQGVIVAYYLQECFIGAPILGLDDQAYVIDFTGMTGRGVILNRDQFTLADHP